jgi:hypothetical protein
MSTTAPTARSVLQRALTHAVAAASRSLAPVGQRTRKCALVPRAAERARNYLETPRASGRLGASAEWPAVCAMSFVSIGISVTSSLNWPARRMGARYLRRGNTVSDRRNSGHVFGAPSLELLLALGVLAGDLVEGVDKELAALLLQRDAARARERHEGEVVEPRRG